MNAEPAAAERPLKLSLFSGGEILLLAAQIAFLVWTRLVQPHIYWDDAYIHFRNALNWSRGDGLLYNRGEWLIGTTSPIYALLLAILHSATLIEIPTIALAFNFVCEIGIVILSLLWLRRAGVPLLFRHLVVLVTLAEPLRMYFGIAGMEMNFYLLAALGIFECFYRRRWLAGGLILGCLGWIRPEGAVVGVALVLALGLTKNFRHLWRGIATAAIVALAFMAALMVTYGTFIPQSIRIKSVAPWYQGRRTPLELFGGLADLTPLFPLTGFASSWSSPHARVITSLVSLAQISLMALGVRFFWKKGQPFAAAAFGGFAVGTYLFYALTRPQLTGWYLIPYFFLSLYLSGVGWWALFSTIHERAKSKFPAIEKFAPALNHAPSLVLAALLLLNLSHRAQFYQYFEPGTIGSGLAFRLRPLTPGQYEPRYIRAAEILNPIIGGDDKVRVGCAEIGVFGYFYDGRILDTYGLVSPEVADGLRREPPPDFDPARHGHIVQICLALKPEFILSGRRFLNEVPPSFEALYQETPLPALELRFFIRRDLLEKFRRKSAR